MPFTCGLSDPQQGTSVPPSSATAEATANQIAAQMVSTTRAFLRGQSNTPGATIELREISRDRIQGKLVVRYRAYVRGVPVEHLYSAYAWPITQREPSAAVEGATLGKDGVVMCAGRKPDQCSGDKPDDPVDFAFLPVPAEPVRLALISEDKTIRLLVGAVPLPLESKDHDCKIEAIRLTPKWELAMVRVIGFKPNESVHFISDLSGEKKESDGKADANGEYVSALLPFVVEKDQGTTKVRVIGAQCSPEISFDWGK
jgi:hypothetical protein